MRHTATIERHPQARRMATSVRWFAACLLAVALGGQPGLALATGVSGFSLGALGGFAVVVDHVSNFQMTSDSGITGNVGIGNMNGNLQLSQGTVSGAIDFASATLPSGVTAGTPGSGSGGTQGSIATSVAAVNAAITVANTLSNTYAGYTGAQSLNLSVGSGGMTVQAAGGTNMGTAYVYNVTAGSMSNGNTLTINGGANDYVVFDIAGNVNIQFNAGIALTGGIAASHVLFNYTGTNTVQSAANGAAINATIIAPNTNFHLNNTTFNGTIFAGGPSNNGNDSFAGTHVAVAAVAPVPEPASLALFAVALGGIVGVRRWGAARYSIR